MIVEMYGLSTPDPVELDPVDSSTGKTRPENLSTGSPIVSSSINVYRCHNF